MVVSISTSRAVLVFWRVRIAKSCVGSSIISHWKWKATLEVPEVHIPLSVLGKHVRSGTEWDGT